MGSPASTKLRQKAKNGTRPYAVTQPTLSIVIPLLNEASILHDTYQQVNEVMQNLGETYELVFVNDGSSDASPRILEELAQRDHRVVVVNLARNFGHELATTAGLKAARGKAAVILDADLQDPPEMISDFVTKWREGYDVVYGVRRTRNGETRLKKATAFFFYRLMAGISDIPIPRDTGDFRLIDRRVIEVFGDLKENPRFFRGMISWIGFRQVGLPFNRRPRIGGVSKYRYGKLIGLAFDTITSFSLFPAQAVLGVAVFSVVLSVVAASALIGYWTLGSGTLGPWQWFSMLSLFVLNMNLICLAVLGQYVVRTHRNTQNRPLFTLESIIRDGKSRPKIETGNESSR